MALTIKNITVRNFMSIGNQTQAIDFDHGNLTLVLGENLDLGGSDSGARNGTGKSTIINSLSYALYGQALTNIKRDNLINKINNKNMLVTVSFEINGVKYHIERGRKPSVLKFTVNGHELESTDKNEAQGDSRETQKAIEDVISMSHDMFKHLVALNTYTEPFLSMKTGDQRAIIEQLLGITLLSEKAALLKEQIKATKDLIATETTKIETIKASNDKIQESIHSLIRKEKLWNENKEKCINDYLKSIDTLEKIDIDTEIINHKLFAEWSTAKKERDNVSSLIARLTSTVERELKQQSKLVDELKQLKDHKCHSCGQELHNEAHEELTAKKQKQLDDSQASIDIHENELSELVTQLEQLGDDTPPPELSYDTLEQALNHKNTLDTLEKELEVKKGELNPYTEQIEELQTTALQDISWDHVNELAKILDHQEFLHKLLTNKDSYVRKRIIDQNLAFLNQRLTLYLDKIGLPHTVEFQNDLSVIITQLGQDLDFDNLSRGERNRLILSLSWAFRDVWENLYHPINLLFIDELVDSGMDSNGVEQYIAILKYMCRERDKNIFLISHRDDLRSRVNNVLKVIKENGFTNYDTDVEII